jgi:hypothetical protein
MTPGHTHTQQPPAEHHSMTSIEPVDAPLQHVEHSVHAVDIVEGSGGFVVVYLFSA